VGCYLNRIADVHDNYVELAIVVLNISFGVLIVDLPHQERERERGKWRGHCGREATWA